MGTRTPSFDERYRDMKSIISTIRSFTYHSIDNETLLALIAQIKHDIMERLNECYGDELAVNAEKHEPENTTFFFACAGFFKIKVHEMRHSQKIKMANLLYTACQLEFNSLLQINYFTHLLIEMKRSDEFIDPNRNRFHSILSNRQINLLMRQVNTIVQTLNLSSNQNTKNLYKKIFYLKIVRNESTFHEREDSISQVLNNKRDFRKLLGEKEGEFIPLSYEGKAQLKKLYSDLELARKKRLMQTLEYKLIDGFKKKDLIHIVKHAAMMEVIYCFIDSLEIEQKVCAFSVIAHLQKDNKLDAAISNAQDKIDFCWEVIANGGGGHLSIDALCSALDDFKDATHAEAYISPGESLDQVILAVNNKIHEYVDQVYIAPPRIAEVADVNAHRDFLEKKKDCNQHLKHHPERMMFHNEWHKRVIILADNLTQRMRSVASLVDEFCIPERGLDTAVKVRDLDLLLIDILEIIKNNRVMDATPSITHRFGIK